MDINVGYSYLQIYSVWGSSSSDIYGVGYAAMSDGVILRYDGNSWRALDSSSANTLYGIWGNSSSYIFTVGYNGTILHYGEQLE